MRRAPLLLLILALAGCGTSYVPPAVPTAVDPATRDDVFSNPPASVPPASSSPAPSSLPTVSSLPAEPPLPAEVNLKAAFYPQAPDADWNLPWQEACEEASVLLAANAVLQKGWSRAEFKQQLLDLIDWENRSFGDYKHTTVAQTAEMLQHLGLRTKIHEGASLENVQGILASGHFIVMTFAGKHLGNPFYSNGGPNYHAMLVKGYTRDGKVIVHDVGTKRGENYVYAWPTLEGALHDFADPIETGAKRFIEVIPPRS